MPPNRAKNFRKNSKKVEKSEEEWPKSAPREIQHL
jgi:hypothetical protein